MDIDLASFSSSATTWIVVVAWDRDEATFRSECLVIPSLEAGEIVAVPEGTCGSLTPRKAADPDGWIPTGAP